MGKMEMKLRAQGKKDVKPKAQAKREYAWQVIIVQARRGQKSRAPPAALQTTITYGDDKDSTSIVKQKEPLWNFWTQMPDRGEDEKMRFALTERQASGKMFVRGEAVLDLNKYRHVGKSFELWEPLVEPKSILWGGFGAKSSLELHLTITYCVSDNGLLTTGDGEDTDCLLCALLPDLSCTIS